MKSRGVLYMVAAALAFSLMSMLVKLASARIPTGELVLARVVFTLVASYVMVRRAGLDMWGTRRGALALRGFVGSAALAFYFLAIAHLPLADATTLHFTQPILTALLAWWLLGERVGWSAAFAIACGIAGVLLVVHPGVPLGAGADALGVTFGLLSAGLSAIVYVTVRELSKTEHPLVIVFYFPLIATPLAIPWAVMSFVWPTPSEWLILIGIGVATQLGQVFMTISLSIERAARATAVGYAQICFAVVWQIVIFDALPAVGTIVGAALIIVGTLVVSATAKPDVPAP